MSGLTAAAALGDYRPTNAAESVFNDLVKRLDEHVGQFETLIAREVPRFNRRAESAKLGALLVAAP